MAALGDGRVLSQVGGLTGPVELAGEAPLSGRCREARLRLERRVDLEDAVVDSVPALVDELVQGDPLGHALEERSEAFLALAQIADVDDVRKDADRAAVVIGVGDVGDAVVRGQRRSGRREGERARVGLAALKNPAQQREDLRVGAHHRGHRPADDLLGRAPDAGRGRSIALPVDEVRVDVGDG